MDNRPLTPNQSSAAEEAARLRRQIDAGARAAESINASERPQAISPGETRRVTTKLNDDFSYLSEGAVDGYAPTNEKYTAGAGPYADKMVQQPSRQNEQRPLRPKKYTYPETADYTINRAREIRRGARQRLIGKNLPASVTTAKTVVNRAKAATVNISAFSWGVPVWLCVQLPFALLTIIALGAIAGVESVTSSSGGFLGWVTSNFTTAVDEILKFVGIDIAKIALGLFGASYVITLATGLIMIGILYFQYKIGLLNPIFGNGATFKIGALIMTIVGLGFPILNLFPFILIWMTAVWMFPR